MVRRYGEPVEVRAGAPGAPAAPRQFLWRGRLYVVRTVLAQWVEAGSWWSRITDAGSIGERAVWRVEAAAGAATDLGVYDLVHDPRADRWSLARTLD